MILSDGITGSLVPNAGLGRLDHFGLARGEGDGDRECRRASSLSSARRTRSCHKSAGMLTEEDNAPGGASGITGIPCRIASGSLGSWGCPWTKLLSIGSATALGGEAPRKCGGSGAVRGAEEPSKSTHQAFSDLCREGNVGVRAGGAKT